jgi:SpoVK/Ycf46/Vps4 family AAA+-type ATPase
LRNLVTQHAKSEVIEDVIRGKGKGLVVLLHGPPGVGKTLSAESLAILTDKPLYSVSMADIGLSPRTVESNLRRIFELATHWKAILLFDEADVFLEARSLEDVRRNSLVSTLLRILEYFQGELQMIYGIDICSHC